MLRLAQHSVCLTLQIHTLVYLLLFISQQTTASQKHGTGAVVEVILLTRQNCDKFGGKNERSPKDSHSFCKGVLLQSYCRYAHIWCVCENYALSILTTNFTRLIIIARASITWNNEDSGHKIRFVVICVFQKGKLNTPWASTLDRRRELLQCCILKRVAIRLFTFITSNGALLFSEACHLQAYMTSEEYAKIRVYSTDHNNNML